MDRELSLEELETEHATELPERETLSFFGGSNTATITAINAALAVNAGTILSVAAAAASQQIWVSQFNH